MKKITLLFLLPLLGLAQIQNPEQRIETPVKAVTLFLEGAEVHQQKQISLSEGVTQVVFTNLSSKLIPKSIQLNVEGAVKILSITERLNFLSSSNESPKLKHLKDTLRVVQNAILQLNSDKGAYIEEKDMLIKNKSIGGTDKGVSISELKLAADFFRARVKEINGETLKLDIKVDDLQLISKRIEGELAELNVVENKPTGEIVLLLQSESKVNSTIDLKYVVSDAGWAPYYDLKAEDVNKPISLVYKARVFNNTGSEWSNVKVKLSTSDPTRSASKPIVEPWYLNYISRSHNYRNNSASFASNNMAIERTSSMTGNLEDVYGYKPEGLNKLAQANGDAKSKGVKQETKKIVYEEVQVSELSAEFEIKKTYSIPPDAKPYIVEVTTYSLDASFVHYSIPKVEREAFLLARIIGWEELNLIEGPANVYFAGDYVGLSYVDPNIGDDTLDLSFGRDNKVAVTRTKIKNFNKEKVSGNNRKAVYSYDILVKNNHKNAVTVDVEDQLPVSQNSEIIVEAIELSRATENKDSGKVSWKLLIPPGESQKITFTYSIKYPRNTNVNKERTSARLRSKF